MIINKTDDLYFVKATLAEVLALRETEPKNINNQILLRTDVLAHSGSGWLGKNTTARDVYNNPHWDEALEAVSSAARDLKQQALPEPESMKRVLEFGIMGDELEPDRTGLPEQWSSHRRKWREGGTPIIKISAQINALADVTAERLRWSGAAASALVDLMEEAGWRTEVCAYMYSDYVFRDGGQHAAEITIKQPDEPLDIMGMADVLAFPGFFRTYGFRLRLEAELDVRTGLGQSIHHRAPEGLETDILISGCFSQAEAVAVIGNQVKQFITKRRTI